MGKYLKGGENLEADFHFSSDNKDIVLSSEELLRFVKQMETLLAGS